MSEQNFSETVKEEEIEHLRSVLKQTKMLSTYEKHTNMHTHQLFPRFKHLTPNQVSLIKYIHPSLYKVQPPNTKYDVFPSCLNPPNQV